jgi:type I restriction enzyme R subunit
VKNEGEENGDDFRYDRDTNHEPVSPQFPLNERGQSQVPALALLAKMGYSLLTGAEATALRGGRITQPLLTQVLYRQLEALNEVKYRDGETYPFTEAALRRAVLALEEVPLVEGLIRASENVSDLLRLGKSLEQTIRGDTRSYTCRYVDWKTPENNVFHAAAEFPLQRSATRDTVTPDIVLFVNGIPFATIECKRETEPLEQAISQTIRNQGEGYIPELFKYVQLVIALKPDEARYGTVGASAKYWGAWRGEGVKDSDDTVSEAVSRPLPLATLNALAARFIGEQQTLAAAEEKGRYITEQDRALFCLCRPERLLELVSRFIVYEGPYKKIARYNQFYAVQNALARLTPEGRTFLPEGSKKGGVIWHTQGSGKSLTMVYLALALAQTPGIENPRIILVTDRKDLDLQLGKTFFQCGLEPIRAGTGAELRRLLHEKKSRVITTLIHKFRAAVQAEKREADAIAVAKRETRQQPAEPLPPLRDESPDIFALVDESHRSEYGSLYAEMLRVLPNACYFGFTGTPLSKKERSTFERFGPLIHAYPNDAALADGAVVPLLYERRYIAQEVNHKAIDAWFERVCENLSEQGRRDLKQRFSQARAVSKAEQRLLTIAYDVSDHYQQYWQNKSGSDGSFKAQLIAPDKRSAIRLHRTLQEIGSVSSAVVISPPDQREGYETFEEDPEDIVQNFWSEMMRRYGTEERYNEAIISDFSGPDGIEILVVVDKLITGFDVPRNTVLYLARKLHAHTLLQAIARVNRLSEGKDYGYILDYAGVLGELDRTLTDYRELAKAGGLTTFDPEDIVGALRDVRTEVEMLPGTHDDLRALFTPIRNHSDEAEYQEFLAPQDRRDEFNARLKSFAGRLRLALTTEFFYEETTDEVRDLYKADLTRFFALRKQVQIRYGDRVDTREMGPQIERLLDKYLTSDISSVEILTPEPINIYDTDAMEKGLAILGDSASAKADAIASATARTIHERMDQDPALYRKFSELLEETIQAFRDAAITDAEYLQRVRGVRNSVVTGVPAETSETIPASLAHSDTAVAYWRALSDRLPDLDVPANAVRQTAEEIANRIHSIITNALVVDWKTKPDVINGIRAAIDDLYFQLGAEGQITLDWPRLDETTGELLRIAESRLP